MNLNDPFGTLDTLKTSAGNFLFFNLTKLPAAGLKTLPFSLRVLLESQLRNFDGKAITHEDVLGLANWKPVSNARPSLLFHPARVLMQDFTGVPALVDLAALRSEVARRGGDPARVNPVIPVDIVIDHSIQVDYYASPEALRRNEELEFKRNNERYRFLRWAQSAFENVRIVPPSNGIVHQVNLEYLAQVVARRERKSGLMAFPDSVVGTDSHTTMINGLGVAGWGIGGIEAISAMLGQGLDMPTPDVIGVKLEGALVEGTTPTDLTLTIAQLLRKEGVVNKFIEFHGSGLDELSLPDRSMIANMTPEYGATMTYFPVDDITLAYLRQTGRSDQQVLLVEAYFRAQGLFRDARSVEPRFTRVITLDLGGIEPSLAGPKRPQDRVALGEVKAGFHKALVLPREEGGYGINADGIESTAVHGNLSHGTVVLAAITSCTNTSDPFVMVAAGLVARNAVAKGLKVMPSVKTSLAPGSRVVVDYLGKADLLKPLAALGFELVGFGCTTCIGNSGPLSDEVVKDIEQHHLVAVAVLSGNRNFEGRVSPHTLANYLASPPLVVAYALAGTVDIDLTHDPLGKGSNGQEVFLKEIWPSSREIQEFIQNCLSPEMFHASYQHIFESGGLWGQIEALSGLVYPWEEKSTYLREPPYFSDAGKSKVSDILGARVLLSLGDSVTTDHISPAGNIPERSPAGRYLKESNVTSAEFNSYGSRRGNDEVLTRGTFTNPRLKNRLSPEEEGGTTLHLPDRRLMTVYDAAQAYRSEMVPLLVLAGREYGTGSSRDWAAKGSLLLGVRAVLAESFERIHRSNLAGMGVLPLQFLEGQNAALLGLSGEESFDITGLEDPAPGKKMQVSAYREGCKEIHFSAIARLDSPAEVETYRKGGILNSVADALTPAIRP